MENHQKPETHEKPNGFSCFPYYFLAKDYEGRSSINFGIYGIPESILIDKNLKIIKKFIGPINHEDFNNILKLTK